MRWQPSLIIQDGYHSWDPIWLLMLPTTFIKNWSFPNFLSFPMLAISPPPHVNYHVREPHVSHTGINVCVYCPLHLPKKVTIKLSVNHIGSSTSHQLMLPLSIPNLYALSISPGSYRVLLKSTCAFFFTLVAFFSCNFLKSAFLSFFLGKNVLFSVEPPIFSQKYHYFEGFGHKETNFFFKICYSMLISLKKFSALLHSA